MTITPRRVVMVTFGTRGDVIPFCLLGEALIRRGHSVRLVTTSDYRTTAGRYPLDLVDTGPTFAQTLNDPELEGLFRNYFSAGFSTIRGLLALKRRIQSRIVELMLLTLDEISRADLVVFNAFAFFAGAYALEAGLPAIRVMCQPLLPSRKEPLSLFGGRRLGGLGNRMSYEAFRLLSPMLHPALATVRRRTGAGRNLSAVVNPLSQDLARVHHLAAYSPALSPDPGDWPVPVAMSGAWHAEPAPNAALSDLVRGFLDAGPPPISIGFGSMLWGGQRNADVVLRALALWGGRAIVNTGPGSLSLPPSLQLPETILAVRHVDHALLFPRVAAAVHHGGAGTTAAALRAGRPNVVLPLLGDQLYWGRRVAALGAAEAPILLKDATPEELAARIARACTDPSFAEAAARVAAKLADEPGVEAAADVVESLLRHDAVIRPPSASHEKRRPARW